LGKIVPSRRRKKIDDAKRLFEREYDGWKELREEILKENAELEKQYQNEVRQLVADKQEFLSKT
jgi:hypothetical protein